MLGTRSRKQSLGSKSLNIISLYLFLTNEDKGPVMLVDEAKDELTLGTATTTDTRLQHQRNGKPPRCPHRFLLVPTLSSAKGRQSLLFPGPHSSRQEPILLFMKSSCKEPEVCHLRGICFFCHADPGPLASHHSFDKTPPRAPTM